MSADTTVLAERRFALPDEAATLALGAAIGAQLRPGLKLYLHGGLGAGKTTLTRGLLRARNYAGKVKSPTYTLVEHYELSNLYLYHFDFYRFKDPTEWAEAGFRDVFTDDNVCIVEWPERAQGALPTPDLSVHLDFRGEGRDALVRAHSQIGLACLNALRYPPD